jgi:hypothetical protein
MAIRCLKSFRQCCADPHVLTIHDDGSLTPGDLERVRAALGPVRIVTHEEADDLILPLLRQQPHSDRFRREVVFGPKLLDIPLLCPDGYVCIDHDILYLRRFKGMTHASQQGADIVFMLDLHEAYSLTFRQRYFERPRVRLPDRLNAGLMSVSRGAYDLDLIEWFLSLRKYQVQPYLVEQTAWAALCGRRKTRYWDPRQVGFPDGSTDLSGRVALHFITPLRASFESYATPLSTEDARRVMETPPVDLATLPATYTSLPGAFVRRALERAHAG